MVVDGTGLRYRPADSLSIPDPVLELKNEHG